MHHVIVASSFAILCAACTDTTSVETIAREEPTAGGEFPPPVTLAEFKDSWFSGKRSVTIVERAEEGEGYRALGIDVEAGVITYQIVGPREEVVEVMNLIALAGRDVDGCGIGLGTFTPPPVPPPSCGGNRCEPPHYVEKAHAIAQLSCP